MLKKVFARLPAGGLTGPADVRSATVDGSSVTLALTHRLPSLAGGKNAPLTEPRLPSLAGGKGKHV